MEVKNWAGCSQFRESVSDRFRHLQSSKSLLTDTVVKTYEDYRLRCRILNFKGEISKVLFGTLDENDTDCYDEPIRNFERKSEDTTDLLKQHVYVIKSTLSSINDTLADKLIGKAVSNIQTYLGTLYSVTARKLEIFEATFMTEEHITHVNNAFRILQRNTDLVLDSVLHAQSGSIQQKIAPPKLLLYSLKESLSFFATRQYLVFSAEQRRN